MNRCVSLLALVPLVGCGEDLAKSGSSLPDVSWGDVGGDALGGDTSSGADTSAGPDSGAPDPGKVSPLTGVDTDVTVTAPTPQPGCDPSAVNAGPFGAQYPWGGLTIGAKSYTCNKCPGGLSDFQGKWRAHGFTPEGDADYSLGAHAGPDDAELLYVDGNTFYTRIYDRQTDVTVEFKGWFFCGQKPEQANEHLFWVILDANPPGALGFSPGTVLESDVILSWGGERKLITWLDDIGASTSVSLGYCQVGSSAANQQCNDPFAR